MHNGLLKRSFQWTLTLGWIENVELALLVSSELRVQFIFFARKFNVSFRKKIFLLKCTCKRTDDRLQICEWFSATDRHTNFLIKLNSAVCEISERIHTIYSRYFPRFLNTDFPLMWCVYGVCIMQSMWEDFRMIIYVCQACWTMYIYHLTKRQPFRTSLYMHRAVVFMFFQFIVTDIGPAAITLLLRRIRQRCETI